MDIPITDGTNAVEAITKELLDRVSDSNHTLLLLPGGSAASIAAAAWAQLPKEITRKITITLTDERFGPVGHSDSNWKLLQDIGMDFTESQSLPVLTGLSSKEKTAVDWQERLKAALNEADTVLALFGIGDDNHISGIKPGSSSATNTLDLVTAYDWKDYQRITTTALLFSTLSWAAIYTEGQNKADAVAKLQQDLPVADYPDQLIKQVPSFVIYYKQ